MGRVGMGREREEWRMQLLQNGRAKRRKREERGATRLDKLITPRKKGIFLELVLELLVFLMIKSIQ